MRKLIRQLKQKRDNFNLKLKSNLESLPSDAKMNIVLLMMAFYLIATVIVFIGIIRERSNDMFDIRHIETVPLIDTPVNIPQSDANDTAFYYQPENNNLVNK